VTLPTAPPRLRWLPQATALGCAAAFLVWLRPYGLEVSRDGAHYLYLAFRMEHVAFTIDGGGYPIGYPLLLWGAMQLFPLPLDAALAIDVVSLFATLSASAWLLSRATRQPALAALAVLALATLPPFLWIHTNALSEAPFAALVVLHVAFVVEHARSGRVRDLILAASVAGAAVLVRYIGYALVLTFSGYVLWQAWEARRELRRLAQIALAHALCWVPSAAIALAHAFAGRRVHGNRGASAEPLGLNIERAATSLWHDLGWAVSFAWAVTLVLALASWRTLRRARTTQAAAPGAISVTTVGDWLRQQAVLVYPLLLVIVYAAAIVVAATATRISPVGSRFFAPFHPLFIVVGSAGAGLARGRARRFASVAIAAAWLALIAHDLRQPFAWRGFAPTAASDPRTRAGMFAYAASPAARSLSAFVRERAREGASLSNLEPVRQGGQHPALARTLLFARASLPSAAGTARYAFLGDPGFGFGVRFADGTGLDYRDLPIRAKDTLSAQALIDGVARVMEGADLHEHWLLVPIAFDPFARVAAPLRARVLPAERRDIGPYRAYRFVRPPAAASRSSPRE